MNNSKQDIREKKINLIIYILAILFVLSPLFTKYCIQGHDISYHLLRIESLKAGILMGKPFLKVNTLFLGGMGYASSMFYPDLLLYFPAVLRVMGVGINTSFHMFVALCVILAYMSSYLCGYKITGSRYMGTLTAILMIISQYYLDDIFVRSAVGEYTAYIFLPFVIYGIYNALYEDFDKPWYLGIGYGGVLMCHSLTFFMSIIFGLMALIIKWKRFFKKSSLIRLLLTIIITMGVTCSYWLPMLEQMLTTKFYVSSPWIEPAQEARLFGELFSLGFPAFGPLLIVLALIRIVISKNEENKDMVSYADWLMIGGSIFLVCTTDIVPWDRLGSYLSFVQFPWRFFLICCGMVAFADMIYIFNFIKVIASDKEDGNSKGLAVQDRQAYFAIAIFMAALLVMFIRTGRNEDIQYYDYSNDYYSYVPFTGDIIAGEWLPETVVDKDVLIENYDRLVTDSGEELPFERVKNSITVNVNEACDYIEVPFVFYDGYRAEMLSEAGEKNELNVTSEGDNGVARVYINGLTGQVRVWYDGTTAAHVATVITVISICLVIGLIIYKKKQKFRVATVILSGLLLCGCGKDYDEVISHEKTNIDEIAQKAEAMYNRNEEDTDTIEPEEEESAVLYNRIGYESSAKKYIAVMEEGSSYSDATYSIIEIGKDNEEVPYGVEIKEEKGFYKKLAKNVVCNESTRYDSITDSLLKLELFGSEMEEDEREALLEKTFHTIKMLPKKSDYVYVALISMFAYDYAGIDKKAFEDYKKLATEIFSEIEKQKDTENINDIAKRYWAAAQLYKLTGDKRYRNIVEEICEDDVPTGLSEDMPGYMGSIAYMTTVNSINTAVSEKMIKTLFDNAREYINEDINEEFKILDDLSYEERMDRIFDKLKVLVITNSISRSVDYTNRCSFYIGYLCGMNPEEISYIHDTESVREIGFVLKGLEIFYDIEQAE